MYAISLQHVNIHPIIRGMASYSQSQTYILNTTWGGIEIKIKCPIHQHYKQLILRSVSSHHDCFQNIPSVKCTVSVKKHKSDISASKFLEGCQVV